MLKLLFGLPGWLSGKESIFQCKRLASLASRDARFKLLFGLPRWLSGKESIFQCKRLASLASRDASRVLE